MYVDTLITNGFVLTMDDSFAVLEDGSVGILDGEIVEIGSTERLKSELDARQIVDASAKLVLPGLINSHVHVADILSRGLGSYRILHDWKTNAKGPFVAAMETADHEVSSELYCHETISSGITTFVENAGSIGAGYPEEIVEAKLRIYDEAGIRNIYAHGFVTDPIDGELAAVQATFADKHPEVTHPTHTHVSTADGLKRVKSLLESYHGTAEGRQSVWPAPYLARSVSPEGLMGAYELAEEYDVMTTTHTAEAEFTERKPLSSVEYLHSVGYLGERCLLGHCVQIDDRDIQLLADSGTKVAHNMASNLALASGIAPIPKMRRAGISTGIGTDNACLSDMVNMFADMRMVSLVHNGYTRNPQAITAKQTLSMATKEGAEAIGRGDDLGSIEIGKQADIILVELEHPHLTPMTNPYRTVVNQLRGHEVTTVICNGKPIMEDGAVLSLEKSSAELRTDAIDTAETIIERVGLENLRS